MTSNLGTRDIQKGPGVGFATGSEEVTHDRMKDKVMEELKRSFRPEFLNRIDEVIVFHSLTRENVKAIVDLLLKRVREQLKAKDVDIELTDAAKDVLAERGYDPSLGARPLRRTIQRLVEDPLSEKLLWKEFKAGQTIIVDVHDGEIVFEGAGIPPEVPPVELTGSSRALASPDVGPSARGKTDGPATGSAAGPFGFPARSVVDAVSARSGIVWSSKRSPSERDPVDLVPLLPELQERVL